MWGLSFVDTRATTIPVVTIFAGIAVVLAAALCLLAVVSFQRARTTIDPLNPRAVSSLVRSGVYRYSRNPMYLGFSLLLLAWAGYLHSFCALAGVAGFVLYIDRFQVMPEEKALALKYPREFENYKATVRRWL